MATITTRTHNPFDEDYWASCLRENLTSSSYGEGLEAVLESTQEPRQSFTRQVFSNMAKSVLNPAKECQGQSYDALVAQTTMVCCRYIMLVLARRINKNPRTFGSLSYASCEELKQTNFVEALSILLMLLEQTLSTVIGISKGPIQCLMERSLGEVPPIYRSRLLLSCQNRAASW